MFRPFVSLIFVPCLVMAGALIALADDPGDAGRGYVYAKKFCAECHGVEPDDLGSPNFIAPPFKAVANTSGMSRRALAVWLQNPHPTMPSLILPRDDMHDVIAYIMSLKEGAKTPTL